MRQSRSAARPPVNACIPQVRSVLCNYAGIIHNLGVWQFFDTASLAQTHCWAIFVGTMFCVVARAWASRAAAHTVTAVPHTERSESHVWVQLGLSRLPTYCHGHTLLRSVRPRLLLRPSFCLQNCAAPPVSPESDGGCLLFVCTRRTDSGAGSCSRPAS